MLSKLCMLALATTCIVGVTQATLQPLISLDGRYTLSVGARGYPLDPPTDLSPGNGEDLSFLTIDKPSASAKIAYFAIINSFSRLAGQTAFEAANFANPIDFRQPAASNENLTAHLPHSQFLFDFPSSTPLVWAANASLTVNSWQRRNVHEAGCTTCYPVFSALNVIVGKDSGSLSGAQDVIDMLNNGPSGLYRIRFYEDVQGKFVDDFTDGHTFAIVWTRPDFPDTRTDGVAIYFGSLSNNVSQTINFEVSLNKTDDASFLDMGIGISYSEGGKQRSIISVNGELLTSSAGGSNDGFSYNSLITVGSRNGDLPSTPAAPSNPLAPDDEFYALRPFLQSKGGPPIVSSLALDFNNPTRDDQLFFLTLESSQPLPVSFSIDPTSDPVCPGLQAVIQATVSRVVQGAITGPVQQGETVELCDAQGLPLTTAQTNALGVVTFTVANAPSITTTYRIKYASQVVDAVLTIKPAVECFALALGASDPCPGALLVTATVTRAPSGTPVSGVTVTLTNGDPASPYSGVTDGLGKADIAVIAVGSWDDIETVQGSAAVPGGSVTATANIKLLSQATCDSSYCPDKQPSQVGTGANRYWEVTADCVDGQGAKAVKIAFPTGFQF